MVGAAPLSSELTLQFQKVLPQAEIGQGYGLTETCTTVTMVCPITLNVIWTEESHRHPYPNDLAPPEAGVNYFLGCAPRLSNPTAVWPDMTSRVNSSSLAHK